MKFRNPSILGFSFVAFGLVNANASIERRQTSSGANCSELQLVIARGTDEPLDPSYGIIVGDPLFQATQKLIPNVTGYAVNYPASFSTDSVPIGANDTINHVTNTAEACPNQKFALVGYSQGADVMHVAAPNISTSLYPQIIALVMFGDPGNAGQNLTSIFGSAAPPFPATLANRLMENCAFGDPVCSDGTNADAHLSYDNSNTTYINASAAYIQEQLQTDGNAGPEPSPNNGTSPGGSPAGEASALASLASLLLGAAPTSGSTSSSSSSTAAVVTSAATSTQAVSATQTSSVATVVSTECAQEVLAP